MAAKEILCRIILGLCILTLPSQAISADRSKLNGFGQFQFGMFERALRSSVEISRVTNEDEGRRLYAKKMTRIAGNNYEMSFLLKSGRLDRINLMREFQASDTSCTNAFNSEFGKISVRYGRSDFEPERSIHARLAATTYAPFTFEDGATIKLGSFYLSKKCSLSVVYSRGEEGQSF